jgi:endoglucanase
MLDRGINLGNVLDARRGTEPAPWPGADVLAAAGLRTVRVPVCWTDHLDDFAAFAAGVDAVVDELLERGLDVVIDVHHFDAPEAGVLTDLWRRLATRFADRPLTFELLNEPRMAPAAWNELAAAALAAVREVDAERRVIVGPAAANTLEALHELRLPADDNLALTVHYYEPFRFTHQGAWWEPGADAWLGTTWGSAADRAAVTADLERAAVWAGGRELFMGEFGAIALADRASRLAWTEWVRREAERLGIGWCYWALGTEFAVYDPVTGWDAALLATLVER